MTNESIVADKRKSLRKVIATVIAVILVVSVFASTAYAEYFNEYNVTIVDNGKEITVTTNETEPIEILNQANISLESDDKLDITSFEQGEGGKIVINRLNSINVEFDDTIQTYNVYASTVGDALEEIGVTVSENDEINYQLTDFVEDGMVIDIKSAFSVSLKADGETAKYAIVEGTVADLLNLAGIKLSGDDYTKPAIDKPLKADMKVEVFRVTYKEETKTAKIEYKTVKEDDKTLAKGKTKVVTKGVDGEREETYKVKYVNGKKDSSEKISEKTITPAVTEVVKVGTKKVKKSTDKVKGNGVKSKNGYTVGQKISGRYTHYCACATCNGNSRGITSSGKKIYNGMENPYYVACNWLPLGSVIEVKGHNYTVVDRGGSGLSKKGRIDIFTPEGHSACYRYGTGSCTIKIVRLGW